MQILLLVNYIKVYSFVGNQDMLCVNTLYIHSCKCCVCFLCARLTWGSSFGGCSMTMGMSSAAETFSYQQEYRCVWKLRQVLRKLYYCKMHWVIHFICSVFLINCILGKREYFSMGMLLHLHALLMVLSWPRSCQNVLVDVFCNSKSVIVWTCLQFCV